jgi:hypothetical protein
MLKPTRHLQSASGTNKLLSSKDTSSYINLIVINIVINLII